MSRRELKGPAEEQDRQEAGAEVRERAFQGIQTFQTLQDPLDGAGATAAAHGHVELVLVVGHGWDSVGCWQEVTW